MPAYLFDKNKQSRYRLWTNSKTIVHNFGAEFELRYLFTRKYYLSATGSYQTLKNSSLKDGLEDGFNTPEWIGNIIVGGNDVYKKLSFNLAFKYQSSFYWQSFLVNGNVPAVFNMDGMISYFFSKPSLRIKLGASNLLNHFYYSYLGGPQIGGFYYTTITWSIK
jgi:hypothetical protein